MKKPPAENGRSLTSRSMKQTAIAVDRMNKLMALASGWSMCTIATVRNSDTARTIIAIHCMGAIKALLSKIRFRLASIACSSAMSVVVE